MAIFKESVQRQRKWTNKIKARVVDAGGGHVRLLVHPDTEEYPPVGTEVTVTWERPPTREEAVRQVIHDAILNDSMLGIRAEIHTPAYGTMAGPIDPFSEIANRVLAALEKIEDDEQAEHDAWGTPQR